MALLIDFDSPLLFFRVEFFLLIVIQFQKYIFNSL